MLATTSSKFSGLGYFTLPLVKYHPDNIERVIAIEKNEDSYSFLKRNISLNKLDGKIFPVLGDNRIVAEEYVGSADRILMGYLPNTYDFISRALQFAKKNEPVTVHYHHLCKKSEYRVLALKDWTEVMKVQGFRGNVRVDAFTKVKSYAPLLFHCCADLLLLVEG
eukprot:TRINITY_DN265_c0_g2_i11.p1 TRINITY_DN265_c0_g2~~TRINITY_DN265_c0_g2_i11.p1  ORF type:complete len:165 (+),score=40.24 TRINITY_DN265_c0_g2_i11:150-644(+)